MCKVVQGLSGIVCRNAFQSYTIPQSSKDHSMLSAAQGLVRCELRHPGIIMHRVPDKQQGLRLGRWPMGTGEPSHRASQNSVLSPHGASRSQPNWQYEGSSR